MPSANRAAAKANEHRVRAHGAASEGRARKPQISLDSKKVVNMRKKLQEERSSDKTKRHQPKGNRPKLKRRTQPAPECVTLAALSGRALPWDLGSGRQNQRLPPHP